VSKRRAAAVPRATELVAEYEQWLAADGRGSACYRNAAWAFLGHWPRPTDFAAEPLEEQLALSDSQRPFLTFLMLTGRCQPSYDYLASRKIGGLLAQATRSPLAADVTTFTTAATDLDYGGHVVKRAAERVAVRLLIGTGRPLRQLTTTDLDELAAAFRRHAEAVGNTSSWANDRTLIGTAHRVLFHLGVLDSPPPDPRQRPGWPVTTAASRNHSGPCCWTTARRPPPPAPRPPSRPSPATSRGSAGSSPPAPRR